MAVGETGDHRGRRHCRVRRVLNARRQGLAKLAARVIEIDRNGALPELFVVRRGCDKPAVQRVALPLPQPVRWRPD